MQYIPSHITKKSCVTNVFSRTRCPYLRPTKHQNHKTPNSSHPEDNFISRSSPTGPSKPSTAVRHPSISPKKITSSDSFPIIPESRSRTCNPSPTIGTPCEADPKDSQEYKPPQGSTNNRASTSKTIESRTVRAQPNPIAKPTCPSDRYIPRRCDYSFEAANYLLTRRNVPATENEELDVFGQIDVMPTIWRKRLMHKAMMKQDVVLGLKQTQILRGCPPSMGQKVAGSLVGKPSDLLDKDSVAEGMWKSNPRKQPLIGVAGSVIDMRSFRASSRFPYKQLDWSSASIVAAAVLDTVMFFNTQTATASGLDPLKSIQVSTLKWNNAGDKLAICTVSSTINLYGIITQKYLWTASCSCVITYDSACLIRCLCWSERDTHILTGCTMISIYNASNGRLVQSIFEENCAILAMAFSPNYKYLVTTSEDKNVRIYSWPSCMFYLQMSYYEPVKAIAWHPEVNGLLCVGGGLHDASLSLWNVNKQEALSYRRVKFCGCVENLLWNKQSSELVVHWSHREGRKWYTVMPVMASIDRIVDVIPVDKKDYVGHVLWNWDHTQFAAQVKESLMVWDFFGSEDHRSRKVQKVVKDVARKPVIGMATFRHFTIR